MNLLQAEFKSVKEHAPEKNKSYLLTDGYGCFAVASFFNVNWYAESVYSMSGYAEVELDFEPTHFAEIKTGETK